MNLFNPRTFSTDWELMVVDRLGRCVDTEKLVGFAGVLSSESGLPIQIDYMTLECALGVNRSLADMRANVQRATDRAGQLLREFDLDLFPLGAHPVDGLHNSSHIHVGTVTDESAAIRLEGVVLRYAPVFAALAANAPASSYARGAFKSYRVQGQAHGCTRPNPLREPETTQSLWGLDVLSKLYGIPTLEIRITDCASSRRLLPELCTFVAAVVQQAGTRDAMPQPTVDAYREFLVNRWSAAKHGMQATFLWDGRARPVADIVDEMLDEHAEGLAALGATRADLAVLEAMRARRLCQADFLLGVMDRYPDPVVLSDVAVKLLRDWDAIDEFLTGGPTLEPVPAPDEDAIIAAHLAFIGEGTHFYRTREAMYFPPPMADALVDRMVADSLVRREVGEDGGVRLTRLPTQVRQAVT